MNIFINRMKKTIILLLTVIAVIFSGCSHTSFSHVTYFLDYKIAGKGLVFITESNSVNFDYEPLGSIIIIERPGVIEKIVPVSETEQRYGDNIYGNPGVTKKVHQYAYASAQSALDYTVESALKMGGDAIINLKVDSYILDNERVVEISGMVVRRNI